MSKQIIEQIKNLSQKERIELFKQLGELQAKDTNYASQGIDPGTQYWDDHIAATYPEKVKTGEVLPGPITPEDVKTGEADKIAKENND